MFAMLQLGLLFDAYGKPYELRELLVAVAARLEELVVFTDGRAVESGREDFFEHAAMYRRDRDRVVATGWAFPGGLSPAAVIAVRFPSMKTA